MATIGKKKEENETVKSTLEEVTEAKTTTKAAAANNTMDDTFGILALLYKISGRDAQSIRFTPTAYQAMLTLLNDFVDSFLQKLPESQTKTMIPLDMVKDYILNRTMNEVQKHAVRAGTKACESILSNEPSTESLKASLILERTNQLRPQHVFEADALAYLNGCIGYLCAEIIELSFNTMRDYRHTAIAVKHIHLAITNDPELFYSWPRMVELIGAGENDPTTHLIEPLKASLPRKLFKPTTSSFEILLKSSSPDIVTTDVVIGNFMNALEGANDPTKNQAAYWLNENPPGNFISGTVLVRDVSMRVPAMVGTWKAGHLYSNQGCCGAMFWHSTFVGPDDQSAANLIQDFARAGMQVIENVETPLTARMGLRLIGRYSWDYYRNNQEEEGPSTSVDRIYNVFGPGPHCYFVDAQQYKDLVYPDLLSRSEQLERGEDTRLHPYVNRVSENGALAIFSSQEYMFAKIFLQASSASAGAHKWIGVRAILVYTYNIGETWQDCQIESTPIN